MLRGIFMTPGATPDQVGFYVDLLKKVRETPEWKTLMNDGAFNQTFMTGADYAKWVENEEKRHRDAHEGSGLPRRHQLSTVRVPPAAMPAGARVCSRSHERKSVGPRRGRSVATVRSKSALRFSGWLLGAIVIVGSLQVGIDWGVEGPKSGFFPFYLGVMIVGGECRSTWSASSPTSTATGLFAVLGPAAPGPVGGHPDHGLRRGGSLSSGSTSRRCC